ncbi:hypothetical protein N7G274_006399 [Stereocaulon virgatum]|uniref:Uncharacterized protein n=1 Tax=Stereocaulon virgatum TaxID=373712 RepID=A0ABR4A7Q5_9LECA
MVPALSMVTLTVTDFVGDQPPAYSVGPVLALLQAQSARCVRIRLHQRRPLAKFHEIAKRPLIRAAPFLDALMKLSSTQHNERPEAIVLQLYCTSLPSTHPRPSYCALPSTVCPPPISTNNPALLLAFNMLQSSHKRKLRKCISSDI